MIAVYLNNQMYPGTVYEAACRHALDFLADLTGYRWWLVAGIDAGQWRVQHLIDRGPSHPSMDWVPWAEQLGRRMIAGEIRRAAPSVRDLRDCAAAPGLVASPVRAFLSAPLVDGQGTVAGALCGLDPAQQPAESARFLVAVDYVARTLMAMKQLEQTALERTLAAEAAEALALHDPLTGLANRRGWDQSIEREERRLQRQGGRAAVLFIDLDHLKGINDAQGHAVGDDVIRRAAQAIRASLRLYDVAARVGGDEFAILAPGCGLPGAESLMSRLRDALDAASVAASLGCALYEPGRPLRDALAAADRAMLAAKRAQAASSVVLPR